MLERTRFIWLDGRLLDFDKANFHVLSHSLHYGSGIFEGIRCYSTPRGPAVFKLAEHVARLLSSARTMALELPYDGATIARAIVQTVTANELTECYIRPIAFRGFGSMGLDPKGSSSHLCVAVWPWGAYFGKEKLELGVSVKISTIRRTPGPHNSAKICGNYWQSTLAKLEAKRAGCDEALLLDSHGFVAEGAGENIFIVKDGELLTPALGAILPGITRDSVMTLARDAGYRVTETRLGQEQLFDADEAFFTGTAVEITPISMIEGRQIGSGKRGPITAQLQKLYSDAVHGRGSAQFNWLTYL